MKTGKQEKGATGRVEGSEGQSRLSGQTALSTHTQSIVLQKTMDQWSTGAQFCTAFHIQGGPHIALIAIEMS